MIRYWIFKTPLGDAGIVASGKGICHLILPGWDPEKIISFIKEYYPDAEPGKIPAPQRIEEAMNFVSDSLMGSFKKIKLKLDLSSLTEFQKKTLKEVCKIKRGKTRTYSWLAGRVGNPKAVRAVAQALARNPLPLFIPCHRIIGEDGSLKGFSAPGGVNLKKYLLHLERSQKK